MKISVSKCALNVHLKFAYLNFFNFRAEAYTSTLGLFNSLTDSLICPHNALKKTMEIWKNHTLA